MASPDPTRRRIVEGEPGIFPPPVASVLRAFGRLFTGRRRKAAEEPTPPAATAPPEHDATE